MNDWENVQKALRIAFEYGMTDGDHHKLWVIDQMVRVLTNCQMETKQKLDVATETMYEYEALGGSDEYDEFCRWFSWGDAIPGREHGAVAPGEDDDYYGEWAEGNIPP